MNYYCDKVAVVTGAASGIGAGLARALAEVGARVVAADIDENAVRGLADDLCGKGRSAIACRADVRCAEDVRRAVELAIERFGRLDIMINNAGVGLAGELHDVELADWKQPIDVNLWGVIHGVHAAYPVMLRQGSGQIVNIASSAGLVPRPGMVPYATTKYAVVGLSTSLRAEAEDLGIRVNVVCPFNIATSIYKHTVYKNLDREALLADIPFRPIPVDRCVRAILKGIRRNRAIIIMPLFARIEWLAYRLFPPMATALLRRRKNLFRKHRNPRANKPRGDERTSAGAQLSPRTKSSVV